MGTEEKATITLTIDGKQVSVPKGTTVYHAAIAQGKDIPIFCYHDRMPPFGACRVCLVEVEKMNKLQASCTLEATEGMVVHTHSERAKEGRKTILELLLINHPLDCPICDRGGECPLQDQTEKFGPGESRFYEDKRLFKKPLPLGPVLMLDRERCITCARCTRFGDVVSGDHALEFIDRGYRTEVGTPNGGPAVSKFIGNTIMICPVGALTSQVYRFRARPWDNNTVPTTCTLCPVGCSMALDSRDGEIMRTRSCENRAVNDVWLCDKGWFGYEFSSSADRLTKPLARKNNKLVPISWEEAFALAAEKFRAAKSSGQLAGWGGNPLTVEENFLFQQLFRQGAGVNNLDHRIGGAQFTLDEEGIPAGMEMEIGECEALDNALLLGLDLTEEFPLIWLRLKNAINHSATVSFMGHYAPEIAKFMNQTLLHAPGRELEMIRSHAEKLLQNNKGGKTALFVGPQYLSSPNRKAILNELLKLKKAHPALRINIMEGRGNSMGARLAGMRPDAAPNPGLSALEVLQTAATQGWRYLHVAGADPAAKFPSKLWTAARSKIEFLVVQDLFLTETAQQADLVLPTLSFVEKEGTFLNIEGRARMLQPGKEIPESLFSDGDIFAKLGEMAGVQLVIPEELIRLLSGDRISLKLPAELSNAKEQPSHGNDNALKASFAHALFDQGGRMKRNTKLLQLANYPYARVHPNDLNPRGLQHDDWAKIGANGTELEVKVTADSGVAQGTVVLPMGFEKVPVGELGGNLLNGMELTLVKR